MFETTKSTDELIEYLRDIYFADEQSYSKELIFSDDVEAEISSNQTDKNNQAKERRKAITKKEAEGFNYIGTSGSVDDNESGISVTTSMFMVVCKILFLLMIIASAVISYFGYFIYGISTAVSAFIGFGLIFILGDILKNIVEINKKLGS